MNKYVEILGRRIGAGYPTYIVAEMPANNNQDFDAAVEIIKAAKTAGADADKIQTYNNDTLTTDCDNKYCRIDKGRWCAVNFLRILTAEGCRIFQQV